MIAPPALTVIAQTVCNLPQCTFCKDIDPDSWAWIFSGCWIFSSAPAIAGGVFMAAYVGIQLWAAKGQGR